MKCKTTTFQQLELNQCFWLEDPRTSDVLGFKKIKPVRRSSKRPFYCNAMCTRSYRTVSRGYIVEDTIVYIETKASDSQKKRDNTDS
jgi:hypothetical protein